MVERFRQRMPTPPESRAANAELYDHELRELMGEVMGEVGRLHNSVNDQTDAIDRLEARFASLETDVHTMMRRIGWIVGALTSGAVVAFELWRALKP